MVQNGTEVGGIWRSFNDYFRDVYENAITQDIQNLSTENLTTLLKILNETDNITLLMKAEVHRNLGQFEENRELLNRINDPQIVWVKDKFLQEINNQNKRAIQLE